MVIDRLRKITGLVLPPTALASEFVGSTRIQVVFFPVIQLLFPVEIF